MQPPAGLENQAVTVSRLALRGFTCGCSRGTEEAGSSSPAEAESGCKAGGASREGTSHSRRCMEVEDLSWRKK